MPFFASESVEDFAILDDQMLIKYHGQGMAKVRKQCSVIWRISSVQLSDRIAGMDDEAP